MNSLLPRNASRLERHIEQATGRLEVLPAPFERVWDPDTCEVALLPWLAWAFSVDEWDSSWTEAQKRKAINDSPFIHRHKGTPAAVERALSSLAFQTTLIEWFEQEPPAAPYTFLVETELTPEALSPDVFGQVMRLINAAKNLRSHYTLRITAPVGGGAFAGGAMAGGAETPIPPYFPTPALVMAGVFGGAVTSGTETPLYYPGYTP